MERRTQSEVNPGEQGYLLLAMVLMVSLVLIALAVAAPVVARDLQRDKEVESMHRQQEYVRALRLYYRKFKSYPPSIDALEKSNNVRFLRKQYIDPLTGKADWRLIHVGENQTTVKGFFGEPLGGIDSTGADGANLGSAASLSSGPTNALAAGFSTSGGSGSAGSSGSQGASGATGSSSAGGFGGTGIGGTGSGSTGSGGTGIGGMSNGIGSSSSSSLGSGGVGQIMGVGTAKSGNSILTPNQQTTYDTWEYLYDPRIELMYAKSNILGGGGMGSQSATSFGSDATSGQKDSGTGSNGLSGFPGSNSPGSNNPGSTNPASSFPGSSFPSSPTTPH